MTKRKRAILMSVMTLMLCLTLVAGGTYALFTDSVPLRTHLHAGEMDITLKRISLESKYLAEDGFLDTNFNDEVVDFTNPTTRNVFDLTDESLIVPCTSYIATMQIENNKTTSDVAFGYWVEIALNTHDPQLAEQLLIRVQAEDGTYVEHRLSQSSTLGSEQYPIKVLARGESGIFKVTVTFLDDRVQSGIVNNDAMNENVWFDVIVHAVQVTDRQ